MKKILTILLVILFGYSYSQTHNPDFLDGRVMFKLNYEAKNQNPTFKRVDMNLFGLPEDINKYPVIAKALDQFSITKFERPSYFTGRSELKKIYRVTFSNFAEIDAIVAALSQIEGIEFAEKEPIYKTSFIPNDTYHTGSTKWYHTLVGSETAWNTSLGSNLVKVAIVDNAVYCNHTDLATYKQRDVADVDNDATPPQQATQNFSWSHGTHCAGLATARINNNLGIASLGGNVELIGVKATPNSGSAGSIYYGYEGVEWACENGAHVVSMSFGGSTPSSAMQTLINAYPEIVFFAAAGNSNNTTPQYPGAYNNVICVGSVDGNDSRSSFSNYNGSNPYVDIAAPGGYTNGGLQSTVYTTTNGYGKMGGTSMATPFAAGLAGLMLSINPSLTPAQIENCLKTTGKVINQNIGNRIDAAAAVACASNGLTGAPIPNFTGVYTSITAGQTVTFSDYSAPGTSPITNWTWTFTGGAPSTFVGQNPPAITYSTAGTYTVSLSVTNSSGTVVKTKTNYINVSLQPYGAWIKQNSGFTAVSRGINYISIVDPNVVWATAYDGSGSNANVQQFTKTTNGGNTWTPGNINVGNTNLGISMVHAYDANTAWAAVYPNAAGQTGGIWKTTNGGTTWTRQNTATFNNPASFTNVVYFWDANNGFCQGDPINGEFELYRTTNGGTTWTLVPGGNIPNPLAGEYGYTRQIEVVADTVWFTTNRGRIYRSHNRGLNWTVYQSPINDFGSATTSGNLSFSSGQVGLIVDNSSNVYKSTNGGATWTTLTTTGTISTVGLCFIEKTNIAFTTGLTGSSYSQDGGVTWNIIDTDQHLYVEFTNPSVGWSGWFNASSTKDGMWKWNNLTSNLNPGFVGTPRPVCVNDTVFYSDATTGGTPTSWQWSFQGGTPSTSTLQNPFVIYNTPGTYQVSLTVNDGTGPVTYLDTTYIKVETLPAQPSVITGSTTPCENSNQIYSVTNVIGANYTWTLPATWTGFSGTNSISTLVGSSGGTVQVTSDNSCGSSTPRTLAVTVSPLPVASFTNTAGPNVSFTNTSSNSNTWQWDFGDGNSSTQQNPTHLYGANGNYTVQLIACNSCGCDTTTSSVTIIGVGINENASNKISVYPNPTKNNLIISGLHSGESKTIRLTDMLGKTVLEAKTSNSRVEVDLSLFENGIYLLKIDGYEVVKVVKD
jgi:PKD repeat protein